METTQFGGSVSVLEKDCELGFLIGQEKVSKSENFLELVEEILVQTNIDKKQIGLIAVSNGPGSRTGVRVGLSLAKGLGDSFGVNYSVTTLLEAMRLVEGKSFEREISAVYLGGEKVCSQIFESEIIYPSRICEMPEFEDLLIDFFETGGKRASLSEEVWQIIGENPVLNGYKLIRVGRNLAKLVGDNVIIRNSLM